MTCHTLTSALNPVLSEAVRGWPGSRANRVQPLVFLSTERFVGVPAEGDSSLCPFVMVLRPFMIVRCSLVLKRRPFVITRRSGVKMLRWFVLVLRPFMIEHPHFMKKHRRFVIEHPRFMMMLRRFMIMLRRVLMERRRFMIEHRWVVSLPWGWLWGKWLDFNGIQRKLFWSIGRGMLRSGFQTSETTFENLRNSIVARNDGAGKR